MGYKLTFIFLLIFSQGKCQNKWFKHLQGFQARSTIIRNDTFLTTGINSKHMSFGEKYSVFLSWNKINGDSIETSQINLDTLLQDSTCSTLFSSDVNGSQDNNLGIHHFIRLGNGFNNDRTYLLTSEKFHSINFKLEDYTIDSFTSYVDDVLEYLSGYLCFVRYITDENISPHSIIYKINGTNKIKIKEYPGTQNKWFQLSNTIANNNENSSFFFKYRITGENGGSPYYWEDYIVKMDTFGNELWRIKPNNQDSINPDGMQFVQLNNGNLIVSWVDKWYRPNKNKIGSHLYQPNTQCTIWLAEVDLNGNVLWRKNLKKYLSKRLNRDSMHNLEHVKALILKDGIVWLGKYSWYYNHNYLLKTSFNGSALWYREFELHKNNTGQSQFIPYHLTFANDGGFLVSGEYRSGSGNLFPKGCQLATIIKVDSLGCLEPECQKTDFLYLDSFLVVRKTNKVKVGVFPNPTSKEIQIVPVDEDLNRVILFNHSGKIFYDFYSQSKTLIDLQNLNSGFYFLKIINLSNGNFEIHKIILDH